MKKTIKGFVLTKGRGLAHYGETRGGILMVGKTKSSLEPYNFVHAGREMVPCTITYETKRSAKRPNN